MNSAAEVTARREEEIAFLAMEQVLGVDIQLADAGAGDMKPDGSWVDIHNSLRRGIVEVTSPPATALMREWARAKKAGEAQTESGSIPLRLNKLAEVCAEMLAEHWAVENLEKLLAQPADERHLFLFARAEKFGGNYFHRLSDAHKVQNREHVDDLVLPNGISDVWFRGRTVRDPSEPANGRIMSLARFRVGSGWHRYTVRIEEKLLPAPNSSIADDPVPPGWRTPKDRAKPTG